ncbi:hypothetical protein ANFP_06110 [Acidithiobacillus ferrooxidans]|nr:hypothetical protein ANFP_06110 [Acidithiobacillus ferrooxidans]
MTVIPRSLKRFSLADPFLQGSAARHYHCVKHFRSKNRKNPAEPGCMSKLQLNSYIEKNRGA